MKKILLTLFLLGSIVGLKAQDEYQAKAFFIYNFTRLVEWPPNSSGEFVIGIVGNNPITSQLERLTSGKLVSGQKIVIKQFKKVEEIGDCNILYISYSQSSKIADIKSKIGNRNTLIVGEKQGLTEEGAAISFILNNDRLSFHINVDNAQNHGLKVSKSLVDMSQS